jgi:nitrite reductase (NADH) small subunit
MGEHIVAAVEDVDDGERVIAEVKGREIAVFNLDGEYHAYVNWCPHQGGPVCEGRVDGTLSATFDKEMLETDLSWCKEDQVLSCAWHGWEFDLVTGECLSRVESEERVNLLPYSVKEKNGNIVVTI